MEINEDKEIEMEINQDKEIEMEINEDRDKIKKQLKMKKIEKMNRLKNKECKK